VALIGDIPFFVGWCLMRFNEYNNKKPLFFDGVFEVLRIVSFSWPLFLGVVDTTKVFWGFLLTKSSPFSSHLLAIPNGFIGLSQSGFRPNFDGLSSCSSKFGHIFCG
jgi:hypothetical protein